MNGKTQSIQLFKATSPPPAPRREMVRFRASSQELETWQAELSRRGFANLSDFLREAARRLIFENNETTEGQLSGKINDGGNGGMKK